ncbi:MAG: tetratricopeptide repeat protein [Pyrinomonadaceae bacterium]
MSGCPRLFWRALLVLAYAASILYLHTSLAKGQNGSGHAIFGDFKVDESQAGGTGARTYQVILYNLVGNQIDRQAVTNNGRYRFFDVPNGEYAIAVEFEGAEVTRIPLRVNYPQRTDVRQDISLEWKSDPARTRHGPPATIAPLPTYKRSPVNQESFDKAEKAAGAKQHAEAATLLTQVVDTDPRDYEAWIELGNAYFNLGKLKDAEKVYLRAIDEKPSLILSFLSLGKVRLANKNYEGSVDAFNEAVKLQPTNAEANYFLGEAYLQLKKGSKAVVYLYEALKLEPIKMAEAHLRLAALYNAAGLREKAAAEYEAFLKKKPNYPDRKKLEQYIAANKTKND